MAGLTLYDKVWNTHVVRDYPDGTSLLYIDRHLVQEVSSPQAFEGMKARGVSFRRPLAHIAVADHAVPTRHRDKPMVPGLAASQVQRLYENVQRFGISYISTRDRRHGIVHVIGPELGFTLPGATLVCGDSHTCTHGAFGALAFGIGSSECESIFATQTLKQRKQLRMRVTMSGTPRAGVSIKDIILALISKIGTSGGKGHAIEYTGTTIAGLSQEERMTLCNMSIEAGSRVGMVAPDETTFVYLKGLPLAPQGDMWDRAVQDWKALATDADAVFDRDVTIDVSELAPHISWGTTPEETLPISDSVPNPANEPDPEKRDRMERSIAYMGLTPGMPLKQIAVDRVFIGSCTNGRIEDLRKASVVVKGRKVADNVTAIVVPGSAAVRICAESEGLDRIFRDAGFEWRASGCSMCVAMNDDRLSEGERCASTSNRNFEGRQGVGGRTHLMSPEMAAAAAIAGRLADIRELH